MSAPDALELGWFAIGYLSLGLANSKKGARPGRSSVCVAI
jgi:hypothetical protein